MLFRSGGKCTGSCDAWVADPSHFKCEHCFLSESVLSSCVGADVCSIKQTRTGLSRVSRSTNHRTNLPSYFPLLPILIAAFDSGSTPRYPGVYPLIPLPPFPLSSYFWNTHPGRSIPFHLDKVTTPSSRPKHSSPNYSYGSNLVNSRLVLLVGFTSIVGSAGQVPRALCVVTFQSLLLFIVYSLSSIVFRNRLCHCLLLLFLVRWLDLALCCF